jgi:hypothetical protein
MEHQELNAKFASIARTCWLSAGCATRSVSLALENDPASTIAAKYRS